MSVLSVISFILYMVNVPLCIAGCSLVKHCVFLCKCVYWSDDWLIPGEWNFLPGCAALSHSPFLSLNLACLSWLSTCWVSILRPLNTSPKHNLPLFKITFPFKCASCSSYGCCCCCIWFGSLCSKQLLVCALVSDKHIRLLFILLQTIPVQTLDRYRALSQ